MIIAGGDIMLVARRKNGELIIVKRELPTKMVQELRKELLYCPCCNQKVILKFGTVKIPHFSHIAHAECRAASESETQLHLEGKWQLYEWLKRQQLNPQLEYFLPTTHQRSDLFFEKDDRKYAIEFQCSVIPKEEVVLRTKKYLEAGISPIWILSHTFLKRKNGGEIHLSEFLWTFLTGSLEAPHLFFFSPETQLLTKLQNPYSFSSRVIFPLITSKSIGPILWTDLFKETKVQSSAYIKPWLKKKEHWKRCAHLSAGSHHTFFNSMYLSGLSPSTLPNEIGIPVQYGYLIETPPIQWQFWIWYDVLRKKETGSYFSLLELKKAVMNRVEKGDIKLRNLPFMLPQDVMRPVEEYFSLLAGLGVIQRLTQHKHQVLKKLSPSTILNEEEQKMFHETLKHVILKHIKT